ncbi:hypothetical protein ACFL4N_08260 [Thermodesulfobacteriota bacterium]
MNVLTSGIDTLVLALDVAWKDENLFENLRHMKDIAKEEEQDRPIKITALDYEWKFLLRPFGARGYEWMLISKNFNLRIANCLEPKSRPNVMVEIGSESLWKNGPIKIVGKALGIIEGNAGVIVQNKVSRADICVDGLLSEDTWNKDIDEYIVTRAKKWNIWKTHKHLESVNVGTGTIKARLYDKALEIRQMSKKTWMHDIWGINKAKENERIIRVEFQIRREVLKETGVGETPVFFDKCDEAWSYCTRKWLKFRTRPGENSNLRKTLPWWKEVQNGFYGVQDARPAIRQKALNEDEEQLRAQILGCACSLAAIDQEKQELDINKLADFKDYRKAVFRKIYKNPETLKKIKENVIRKRAKYSRSSNRPERFPNGGTSPMNQREIVQAIGDTGLGREVFQNEEEVMKALEADVPYIPLECPYKGQYRRIHPKVCEWRRAENDQECSSCKPVIPGGVVMKNDSVTWDPADLPPGEYVADGKGGWKRKR